MPVVFISIIYLLRYFHRINFRLYFTMAVV
nr:MAG TPA: hypothetical protein [Bacteriophage sp.]